MRRNRLNMKQPIYIGNAIATIVFIFPNGNFAATLPGENFVRQFSSHGNPLDQPAERAANEEPVTVEIVALYPTGAIYVSGRPIGSSSYGVDQLIQVRVTRRGGRIINKELLP